jgi:hypothetical protein
MKVCRGCSSTEDLILRRERAGEAVLRLLGVVMDLLVSGPGLVLRSVPRNLSTPDSYKLGCYITVGTFTRRGLMW